MINVYDKYDNVIARVNYNNNLDYWDGRNWTNGGTGLHKGLTKLKNGDYVLIHGTQWQGDEDYAVIINKNTALQEILKSGNTDLFDNYRFKELKILSEGTLLEEEQEEEYCSN